MCYVAGNVKRGEDNMHYRQGKTTTKICTTCQVPICANCNIEFHNEMSLELPVYMNKWLKIEVSNKRICRGTLPESTKKEVCTIIQSEKKQRNMREDDNPKVETTNKSGNIQLQQSITTRNEKQESQDEIAVNDKSIVKVKKSIMCNTNNRYYLQQSLRSSQIPKEQIRRVELFATIQNVSGDGNCGIYSMRDFITIV